MKPMRSLGALLFAAALLVGPGMLAQDEKKSCCEATVEAGKKCKHECCVKAAEGGKVCEKCHPKKEDKSK